MSCTELFKFNKIGEAEYLGEVKNSFRGAMAVWDILDRKYLSPLPKPFWMEQTDYDQRGYSRICEMSNPQIIKEIWNLFNDKKISRCDEIVLGTTFDNVVVMRENINEVIKAFEEFDGETSLKLQAEILKEALNDDDLIAVAWNQTSVNSDNWCNYSYDDDTDESIPYNILTQDKHWSLFDEIERE